MMNEAREIGAIIQEGVKGLENYQSSSMSIFVDLCLSDLKEGDVVKHKSSKENYQVYIVTANHGEYAIGIRTVHISNESEWLRLKRAEE